MKTSTKISNVNPMLGEAFKSMAKLPKESWRQPWRLASCPHMGALLYTQIISFLPCRHCHSTNSSDNHCLPDLWNSSQWRHWQNHLTIPAELPSSVSIPQTKTLTFCTGLSMYAL
jgi:hypothetical protein